MKLIGIVCTDSKGGIARQGLIPWHCKEDLRLFKALTMDYPVVMGRKTFESLSKPLVGRQNIVLSKTLTSDRVKVIRSIDELSNDNRVGFLIGGESLYQSIPCDAYLVSRIPVNYKCDQFFKLPKGLKKIKDVNFNTFTFSGYVNPEADSEVKLHLGQILNFIQPQINFF